MQSIYLIKSIDPEYIKSSYSSTARRNQPDFKTEKDLNEFHQKETQATEKHTRKCSDTVSHEQNANQTPKMTNITTTTQVCGNVEKLES